MAATEEQQRTTTIDPALNGAGGDGAIVTADGGTPPRKVEDDLVDEPMTLQEHLAELRTRLIKAVAGVAVGMVGGFFISRRIIDYMVARVKEADPEGKIVQTNMTEAIVVYFKVAFYIGIACAMPIIVYQFIRFLAPGLTRTERRYVYAMLPFIILFFGLGVAFSSFVAIPNMIRFLLEVSKQLGVDNTIRIEEMLSFYSNLALWTGIIFEMPLVMFLLATLNIVPYQALRKTRRYASVGLMIVAAIITPTPDPINMLLVWAPMYLLFEFGLLLARFARPRRRGDAAAA